MHLRVSSICELYQNYSDAEAIEKKPSMRYGELRSGSEQHGGGCTSPSPIRSLILKIVPIGWLRHPRMQPEPKVVLGL